MCGRFALSLTPARIGHVFRCQPPALPARYNIAPDGPVLAIRSGTGGGREAVWLRWGLLPPWSHDPTDPARQINARLETAADKPMFRDAFRRHRCLLPADGFYEWQKAGRGGSQPFFVRYRDGSPMAFAAIFRRSRLANGSELETCAILTTAAAPSIRHIHHRMPALVPADRIDIWLDPTLDDGELLRSLLTPPEDGQLEAVAVSSLVNNPRNDGPELLVPRSDLPRERKDTTQFEGQGRLF